MADKKISALTASTTPLAGTEVLPIVQGGATVKVAVSNLTAGRAVATAALTASGNLRTEYSTTGNVSAIANNTNTTAGATSQLIALNDASRGLRIQYSSSGGFGGNALVNGVTAEAAQIFTDNGYPLVLGVGGSATAVLDTSFNINLKAGNLVIGTSGKGIDFSATPGTGTSELLADYEEGTFTPIVVGGTTAGTATYAAQNGYYTKIGRLVSFQLYVDWSAGTGTGILKIGGLPFTSATTSTFPSITIGQINNITTTASNIPCANCINNSTSIDINQYPIGGGAVTNVTYDAAGYIMLGGSYTV
jgi:hypothetical protein